MHPDPCPLNASNKRRAPVFFPHANPLGWEEASEAMHGSELTRRLKEAEEARKDLELQQEKFLQRSLG